MKSEPISEEEIMQTGRIVAWFNFWIYAWAIGIGLASLFFIGRLIDHLFRWISLL